MAEDGSWSNIQKYGLLSTTAILDKWCINGEDRKKLESELRPDIKELQHPVYGISKLRDQKAMNPGLLSMSLPQEISVGDWCEYINGKVFFWANWKNLKWMLSAQAYITRPHVVITVDSSKLIESYGDKISLSAMNSGSTFPGRGMSSPKKRNYDTFKRMNSFNSRWVTEVAVDYSIPNITEYVSSVKRLVADEKLNDKEPRVLEVLWRR